MVKNLSCNARGRGLSLGLGTKVPQAARGATKTQHSQINKCLNNISMYIIVSFFSSWDNGNSEIDFDFANVFFSLNWKRRNRKFQFLCNRQKYIVSVSSWGYINSPVTL